MADTEAQSDDGLFSGRERTENTFKLVRHLSSVHMGIGWNGLQVWEQFPELRASVTHRLLQGDRLLKGLHGFMESLRPHPQDLRHFFESSRAAQLLPESSGHAKDAVRGFSLVNRNANGPRLIRQRARDALTDPPRCIGAELEPLAILIALGRFHQTDISFLHEIQ